MQYDINAGFFLFRTLYLFIYISRCLYEETQRRDFVLRVKLLRPPVKPLKGRGNPLSALPKDDLPVYHYTIPLLLNVKQGAVWIPTLKSFGQIHWGKRTQVYRLRCGRSHKTTYRSRVMIRKERKAAWEWEARASWIRKSSIRL